MPKGGAHNQNPSPETRFGGPRGNTPGKTSEQRQAEIRNAWLATKIRGQMLEALATAIEETPASALTRIEPAALKLLKDAEDRGLGTPKASVDISNDDGSLKQEPVRDIVLEALKTIHAKPDAG